MRKFGFVIIISFLYASAAIAQTGGSIVPQNSKTDPRDKTYEQASGDNKIVKYYWWQELNKCGAKLQLRANTYKGNDEPTATLLKQNGDIIAKLSIVRLIRDRGLTQDAAVQMYYDYSQAVNTMETTSIMLDIAVDKQINKSFAPDGELGKHTKLLYENCVLLAQKYQTTFADDFKAPK